MICRNCSAEIDDDCQKCPVCKKDPTTVKKGKSSVFTIIAVIVCFALLCGCVYFGLDLMKKKGLLNFQNESTSQSTTESTTEPTDLQGTSEEESTTDSSDLTGDSLQSEPDVSDSQPSSEGNSDLTDTSSALPPAPADSPFNGKTITRIDINDQNGTRLATRAFVEVEKSKVKDAGEEAFLYFSENYIKPSTQSWFTIKFEDGTGIVFSGNWINTASYGELDSNDYIKKVIGRILLTDEGKFLYIATPETTTAPTEAVDPAGESTTESNTEATTENNQQKQNKKKKINYVYVTASGTKYHKQKCAYLKKSKVKIALAKAKKEGYTACSKCFKSN